MKKLIFAAVAAIVMVSVSNVFANSAKASLGTVSSADTATTDTVAPVEKTVEQPADTAASPSVGADDTAMLMMSDTAAVDTATTDTASAKAHDVA